MFSSILIAVPVMIVLAIVQITILPRFSFFPVDPSLPFLFALAWSLLSNVEEGVVWAFIGGVFMDIFTIAPVGGLALTYMASVFAVNLIRDLLPANRFAIPVISAALATTIQQLLYYIYLRLFGISATTTLFTFFQIVIVQTILIIPLYWIMYFLTRTRRSRPVQI
jgi:rod shape-determining protein MreD